MVETKMRVPFVPGNLLCNADFTQSEHWRISSDNDHGETT
jgi:hypothetical protein